MSPDIRVSMDGRNISLFPREIVEENLRFYSNEVTRDDLGSPKRLIPQTSCSCRRGARHSSSFAPDLDWREVFSDSQSSVFLRADSIRPQMRHSTDFDAHPAPSECSRTLR